MSKYITVADNIQNISVDYIETDEDGSQESDNILTLWITPYLTGPEARGIAERVAGLASVNLSDDRPIDWGTNY